MPIALMEGEAEAGHQPQKQRCLSNRKALAPFFDASSSIFLSDSHESWSFLVLKNDLGPQDQIEVDILELWNVDDPCCLFGRNGWGRLLES